MLMQVIQNVIATKLVKEKNIEQKTSYTEITNEKTSPTFSQASDRANNSHIK